MKTTIRDFYDLKKYTDTTTRDNQRMKVYRSEWAVADELGMGTKLRSVEEAQDYVDRVLRSRWFRARFPHAKGLIVEKPDRNQKDYAYFCAGVIKLSKKLSYEAVLIHEIAHSCVPVVAGFAAHGRLFARVYLDITYRFMGKERGDALLEQFKINKVKYDLELRKPRKTKRRSLAKAR